MKSKTNANEKLIGYFFYHEIAHCRVKVLTMKVYRIKVRNLKGFRMKVSTVKDVLL